MYQEDVLVEKIENVLRKFEPVAASWVKDRTYGRFRDEVAHSSLSIELCALADHIYGPGSEEARRIRDVALCRTITHLRMAEGMLRGTIEAIRAGLLADIRVQVLLDVQCDFIDAARRAMADDAKDVAASLLCVVLEDSVKRLALKHGLDMADSEFGVVVVALFKAGAISKSTKGILLAQKDLRNSSLHAQWHEVSVEAVQGLLYFLPSFIEQHGV